MSSNRWLKAPIGPHGARWSTVHAARSVLVVVHTVTAINRLDDILPVFDSDHRVQLFFTFPDASTISHDVEEALRRDGALVMPWAQAVVTQFDLALSAHHSGNLHEIAAPLVVLSHGMGYTKYTESRKAGSVYGMSREWLLRDGTVVPAAIALSHEEQQNRLAATVPEALDAAVVVGDPCFDRLVASTNRRGEYRSRLGANDDTTVITVSSTWGAESLFGRSPELIGNLLAELPCDRYVVAAVLHPNTWFAHGPHQIRLWLGDALRAGLRLVPPREGWQQAILAADLVIGDNGATTGYAAALGTPTLRAAFPEHQVVDASAIGALGRSAPPLDVRLPLLPQLDQALATPPDFRQVRAMTTSVPGRSPELLREVFYRLMDLDEPDRAPLLPPYEPDGLNPESAPVRAWWVAGDGTGAPTRWPADVTGPHDAGLDRHLVVHADHPRRDLYGNAAVVVATGQADDEVAAIFRARPACTLVVRGNVIAHRGGGVTTTTEDPVLTASAIQLLLSQGKSVGWIRR